LKHALPIATVIAFMSARSRLLVAFGVTVLCVTASQARAETAAPVPAESDEQPTAPSTENEGTLGKLLHSRLLILVKPPLPLSVSNLLSDSSHHSGTPPELLTPGNAGVAVRFRW